MAPPINIPMDEPVHLLADHASKYLGREVPLHEHPAYTLREVLMAASRDRDDAEAYRALMADPGHQIEEETS